MGQIEGVDDAPSQFPQRPKLGPRPVSEEAPKEEERLGEVYYRVNESQRRMDEQRPVVRRSSIGGRGTLVFILFVAAVIYFYLHPNAMTSAIHAMGEGVVSLRGQVFSGGKGYGELPEEAKDSR